MATDEFEKSKVFNVSGAVLYQRGSVITITIMKKGTGNVTLSAFDAGEAVTENSLPFDKYIQIIEGTAEVMIGEKKYALKSGEAIVIPAHTTRSFNAKERFKMISTVIKSGYEL